MAACAAERNGMQSNNKRLVPACLSASALSMRTFSRKTDTKKITCQRKNTIPLKDDIIPKPRQKTSEILENNNIFREIQLPAAASSQTASKKSAPEETTPCL